MSGVAAGSVAATRRAGLRRHNVVFVLAMIGLAALWAVTLRPQSLGGPAGYVVIRGSSMEPVYRSGDLVLVRAASSYAVGDVVAYQVPDGDVGAGAIVIHRIIGGSASGGFDLQGDNNPEPDFWHPREADVLGVAWVSVPRAGTLLGWARDPLVLASLAAGFVAATVLRPRRGDPARVDPT